MRRRRIGGGRAAIARRKEDESRFTQTGARMAGATLSHVQEQLRVFRANLEEFARKYKDDIRKDPLFRREFQVHTAFILIGIFFLILCSCGGMREWVLL